ncbi:putative vacuolar membrane protein [Pseudozyma hubeiensis]|nr:putative vacuolar membrane protein [Pseudozyma hubeiensis]
MRRARVYHRVMACVRIYAKMSLFESAVEPAIREGETSCWQQLCGLVEARWNRDLRK